MRSKLIFIFLFIPWVVFAQAEMLNLKPAGEPAFGYDIVNLSSEDPSLSRLNIYFKLPYDELQFTKEDGKYKASYEVSVAVFDEDGSQVGGKDWQREVVVSDYETTNARDSLDLSYVSLEFKPDTYNLVLAVTDLDSKKRGERRVKIHLKDFRGRKLSLSQITFLTKIETPDIYANAVKRLDESDSIFYAYFEVYSQLDTRRLRLSYQIEDSKKRLERIGHYYKEKRGFKTPDYIKIDCRELKPGRHLLRVAVSEGKLKDVAVKPFIIYWIGLPNIITDLESAIEQLRYIAKGSELKKIKEAPQEKKKESFLEFWQKRDPTPGTVANELMDEYYRRVEYANQAFTLIREGWKTDMGMVYILFGPPDDIERHPFERGYKPYEIWRYYHLNRAFIFVDYHGCGEYKLISPISPVWED